ncbi:oxygenase MpaB family protein [Kitasatospora sp. NPDC049285]|uniref:oxygenase MpaB family protein n=1 Tax=Kitasatospora sp. NPDC049285 TaxID=3157096 RepID=UPI003417C183
MGRYSRLHYIQTLDPERDYDEIFKLVTRYEFPWDYHTGWSFALVTDFVIPSITHTLAGTGEFAHRGMKRYDDTMLFPFEAHRDGLDSAHGREAVRALNKIHGRYTISNEDYLHILAGHVVAAIDWINQYGWRPLSDHEQRAIALAHRRLGELMGIKDIPSSYDEFKTWLERDIQERGTWHYANGAMVAHAMRIIAALCPPGTRTIATKAITSMIPENIRGILDQPPLPAWFGALVRRALRARGRLIRLTPPRPDSRPYVRKPRSYPRGWTIGQLGPDHHTESAAAGDTQ